MSESPHRRPAKFPATSRRTVVAVAVGVLLAHLAVLTLVRLHAPLPAPVTETFVTEAIEVAPPAPPPAPPPPPAPQPPRAPPAPRAAPAPKPAPRPAPRATPAPPPAVQAPAPEPTSAPEPPVAPPVAAAGEPAPSGTPNGAGLASAANGVAASSATADTGAVPNAGKSAQVHPSVQLSFALSGLRGGVQPWSGAFGELNWRQDGNAYSADLAMKIFFRTIRRQTSTGTVGALGIAPDRFTDARKAESAALLQRDSGQVVFSSGAPAVPLRPGAQDRLSIVMQLGALIAGDPTRYPQGSEIAVQTIGPRDAEVWVFKVGAEEKVSVPAGEFTAWRLSRQARHAGDYTLDLWLAPAQAYLPVQMRQTEPDGDVFDLQLRAISQP